MLETGRRDPVVGEARENPTMARIGLVLGAGGAVGEGFHVGALAAIAEATGFDPRSCEVVVGTSAGSVVAASLRAGLSATDLFARVTGRPLSPAGRAFLESLPTSSNKPAVATPPRRLAPASPELIGRLVAKPQSFKALKALTALLPEGRRDGAGWFTGFDIAFPDGAWPKEALWICAVSLERGDRVVFGRDEPAVAGSPRVAEAVQASCAIPAIFKPVAVNGRRYVDGGVHSPTNADLLSGLALDAVIVSSPMSMSGSPPAGTSGPLLSASRIPAKRTLRRELAPLTERGVPILTFEPSGELVSLMGMKAMDFSRRGPVAEQTYSMAKEALVGGAAEEVGAILSDA